MAETIIRRNSSITAKKCLRSRNAKNGEENYLNDLPRAISLEYLTP